MLAALDGRWPFGITRASAVLAARGVPAPQGLLALDEAILESTSPALVDVVGADQAAASAFAVTLPPAGEVVLSRAAATSAGAQVGASIALRGHSSPTPYVASFFEMERVERCSSDPHARLCFLERTPEGEARLRLRVEPGARDAAFLPDLVELGPRGLPAWWNGSFVSPSNVSTPFQARATSATDLVPAMRDGEMETGDWTIAFTLDANGTRTAAGAAGIVRVREPGYLWFDDRFALEDDPRAIASAVLANLTFTRAQLRVARVEDALPMGAGALLALDDARALLGVAPHEATALLVNATQADARALDEARTSGAIEAALRLRPLPEPRAQRPAEGALVLVAPDARAPPPGATLALAGRASAGETIAIDGEALPSGALLLSPASGPIPWRMPAGGRWPNAEAALDNVSRARTLALASEDLLDAPAATARVQMGDGNTSRALTAVGTVAGAPPQTLWTSAAFIAGSGKPLLPRLIVPLEPGETREAASAGWRERGYAVDE